MKQWLLFEMSKNSLEEKPTETTPKGTRMGALACLVQCSTLSSVFSYLFLQGSETLTSCLWACSFTHMSSVQRPLVSLSWSKTNSKCTRQEPPAHPPPSST